MTRRDASRDSDQPEPRNGAFTLIELLVAVCVLSLVVALAVQMTAATLTTVSHSAHALDTSEGIRAATMMLRDELSGAMINTQEGRYLNLRVVETDERIVLFFAVPRVQTSDLGRMGFVAHVAYVWDRGSRTLGRAEYHSSREPNTVLATAQRADGAGMAGNLGRLHTITPAYKGSTPYAWTELPWWEERFAEARRNPVLTGVIDWKVECFTGTRIEQESPEKNLWNDFERLPAVVRLSFVVASDRRRAAAKDAEARAVGRRYETIIPIPGAEVGQ